MEEIKERFKILRNLNLDIYFIILIYDLFWEKKKGMYFRYLELFFRILV